MWTLENPAVLFLLLLLPVGIYLRHFWKGRGSKIVFAFAVWKGEGFKPKLRFLSFLYGTANCAFWAAAAFLILAAAGPALLERERVFLSRGTDLMIVLDESPSMAAQDFPPVNRFETARSVIEEFIERRDNDPLGLVSFGADAAMRVPPTLDYDVVLKSLNELRIMDLGDGTAIGMGIAVAALHLKSSSAREKVIILLTDGVNNAGEILPETAAEIAEGLGIRIYSIGIGDETATEIEFTDPHTGKTYRGSFEGGFDEALLQRIAEVTGGAYFYAGSPGTLEAVFQAIDSIETVEKHVRIQVRTEKKYQLFILLSLGLFFFDYLIRRFLLRELL
jgi:Ca-activated chloride channel family protein